MRLFEFPTLTEDSLKQEDEAMQRAALAMPITPETPKEVLRYAGLVMDAFADMMERAARPDTFDGAKQEILQGPARLIEIAEKYPDALGCPDAALRLHRSFVHDYPFR